MSAYGHPREHRFQGSQVELAWYEWGEAPHPKVLLVHATGFHARCWEQVVAHLPPGFHILAVDLRGHGRSTKRGPYVWSSFLADLEEFAAALSLAGAVGVGHSLGGHCITQLAARRPGAFDRLVLVDPVILDPEAYARPRYADLQSAEDHPVARRRDHWAGWEEMFERFSSRKPFSRWRPQVLEDYCRHGLEPRAEGGWRLACPPVVEASIYLGNKGSDVYGMLHDVDVPVAVLRAPGRDPDDHDIMDFSKSPTWPELADRFPRGRDVFLPRLDHFIPMQAPELVARFITDGDADP